MIRIFDHLDGTQPEDRWFSKIARQLRRSPWWRTVPTPGSPAAVSGEIDRSKK